MNAMRSTSIGASATTMRRARFLDTETLWALRETNVGWALYRERPRCFLSTDATKE
jgi:hypothetical protein